MSTGAVVKGHGRPLARLGDVVSALVLIALALIAVPAMDAVLTMQAGLEDLHQAHRIVSKQNDGPIEQVLSTASERMQSARLVANRVAGAIGGLALLGAIAFAMVSSASKWLRFSSLAIVMLLLVRAFFWEVI